MTGRTSLWRMWMGLRQQPVLDRIGASHGDKASRIESKPVASWRRTEPGEVESYRRLALNIRRLHEQQFFRAAVVTSAVPGEGKSTIALNLAAALVDLGQTTILIDADLRKPDLQTMLGLPDAPGLSEWLRGEVTEPPLRETPHQFLFLPCGKTEEEPGALLASSRLAPLLTRLCESANFVLLDSSPLLPFTDGLTLAALAGAAILTVRSGAVTRQEVQQAVSRLRDVGANVLGVALNDVPGERRHRYYRYYQRDG